MGLVKGKIKNRLGRDLHAVRKTTVESYGSPCMIDHFLRPVEFVPEFTEPITPNNQAYRTITEPNLFRKRFLQSGITGAARHTLLNLHVISHFGR